MVLVLVLIFILVVSAFAAAALSKSQAASKTGVQVRDRGAVQYALDAGVEYGLNQLTQELESPPAGGPTLCATAGSTSTLTSTSLNGHTVTIKCTTYGGASRGNDAIISNFALVLRSTASNAFQTYGPGGVTPAINCATTPSRYFKIGGAIYFSGPQVNALDPELLVCGGDVVEQNSSSCFAAMQALTNVVLGTLGHVRDCTNQTPAEATPTYSLAARPSSDPDLHNCYTDTDTLGAVTFVGCGGDPSSAGAQCRVFFPGRYTSPPSTLSGASKGNYFASGTYYFDNIGTWALGDKVVAGRKVTTSDLGQQASSIGCGSLSEATLLPVNAPLIPGTSVSLVTRVDANGGTQWVLGGTTTPSELDVRSVLTLNSRVHTTLNPPAVLVFGGYGAWKIPTGVTMPGPSSTSCTPYYGLCNNNSSENLTVNGRLVAPATPINLFSSSATDNAITGGATVFDIRLGASVPGSAATDIEAPGGSSIQPPPYRTVRLDVTTSGTAATNVAIATVSNFGEHVATVKSWRTG